jgi:2-polyprenyl-3-methyl-5-hydroxy-6-metoxy-1,4-benzoquinol methylase
MSMFFKRRALQAEYFDTLDRPMAEIAAGYEMLGRVNRFFGFALPFEEHLPKLLGVEHCRSVSFLDLGAGDGSLGDALTKWAAAAKGWDWRCTNLDVNTRAMGLNRNARWVAGSVLELPFRDGAFDVVIASQMTHHLMSDEETRRHFREAWRVTGRALLINDLHRSRFLYGAVGMVMQAFGFPEYFKEDGFLSVKRGWLLPEWRRLAAEAGIAGAKVSLYGGARVMLGARRG